MCCEPPVHTLIIPEVDELRLLLKPVFLLLSELGLGGLLAGVRGVLQGAYVLHTSTVLALLIQLRSWHFIKGQNQKGLARECSVAEMNTYMYPLVLIFYCSDVDCLRFSSHARQYGPLSLPRLTVYYVPYFNWE
jgi:hypothetical protein